LIDLKKVKTTPCRLAKEEEDVVRRIRGTGDSLSGADSRRISLRNDVLIPLHGERSPSDAAKKHGVDTVWERGRQAQGWSFITGEGESLTGGLRGGDVY
jgi:hypothetical protein